MYPCPSKARVNLSLRQRTQASKAKLSIIITIIRLGATANATAIVRNNRQAKKPGTPVSFRHSVDLTLENNL